jgi:hypothetical protein
MHFPVQMLGGYKGSAEYILAVVRGDGDLTVAPVSVLKKFIESGDMRGLFTTEKESSVKGVPTVASVGHPELTGLGVDRYVIARRSRPASRSRRCLTTRPRARRRSRSSSISSTSPCSAGRAESSMIPKSGNRFSEKIMLKQNARP